MARTKLRLGKDSAIFTRAGRFEGQSWDRCGTCVIDAKVFHELQGFDEAVADWSLADFDLYRRCREQGSEVCFDPFLLTPIRHGDALRVQFHQEKSREVAGARNREYLESRVGQVNPNGYALGRMEVSRTRQADSTGRSAANKPRSVAGSWIESARKSLRHEGKHSGSAKDQEAFSARLSEPDALARLTACENCQERIGNRCRQLGPRLCHQALERGTICPLGKWPKFPLEQLVTIGVTSFMRPESLARLRRSIRRLYPNLPLSIVDTGGNLSWGRNRLAAELETPYLLLCEDDFEFDERTNIEALVDVLNSDTEIGGVGGLLLEPVDRPSDSAEERLVGAGRPNVWAYDFSCFRDECRMVPARLGPRVTSAGTIYEPCQVILNFGLFRRELLQQFRWDEDLPLCEHRDWYWRVAQSRQWRMAVCHDVSIIHHRDRPEGYAGFRNRTFTSYLKRKNGFRFLAPPIVPLAAGDDFRRKVSDHFNGRVRRISSSRSQRLADCKPNILLYGVGHSGTSIVAEQLFALGWSRCDADEQFAENVSVRRLNQQILLTGQLDRVEAEELLRSLPRPWAVKDPRFAEFLPHWLPVLSRLDQPPLLVWLRREVDSVRASYDKRNERLADGRPGVRGRPVEELCELAKRNFQLYPWPKVSLDVESIADAVELFDASRARGHPTHRGPAHFSTESSLVEVRR